MGTALTLYQKKFIEKHVEQGKSSPWIAGQLEVTVRVVRKWRHRLKKDVQLRSKSGDPSEGL